MKYKTKLQKELERRHKISETLKRLFKEGKRYQHFKKGHKINLGKKHSEETKRKMSKSSEGQIPWNKGLNNKIDERISSGERNYRFKKQQKPWNYIDGRSKNCSPARYGDDWFKIRLLIYKRDNYTCQECGLKMSKETGAFHIHHKIPFLINFDNSLKNLITLCPSCHRKIEAKIIKQLKSNGGIYA